MAHTFAEFANLSTDMPPEFFQALNEDYTVEEDDIPPVKIEIGERILMLIALKTAVKIPRNSMGILQFNGCQSILHWFLIRCHM